MSITNEHELEKMKDISFIVAQTLKKMRDYAAVGMSTKELDAYGAHLFKKAGARSAPKLAYNFPGATCISVNREIAHGIPSAKKILANGDLINIDVSAEKDGFWSDNGSSFVLGDDMHNHQALVDASKQVLLKAVQSVHAGMKISDLGHIMETTAKKAGFRVIRNLAGHGVGRKLHEAPDSILNCKDRRNKERFTKNSVIAIETFIATRSNYAVELSDGWTLVGDRGGFVTQHEHTLIVTDDRPIILTLANGIWN